MPTSKTKPERWLVLPDIHLPREDKPAMRAVEAYMADHTWSGWIQLGDLIDFNEISRWEDGNNRTKRDGAITRAYKQTGEFLDRHATILRSRNKSARMVWIEGNHEFRIVDYLNEKPEASGMLEIEKAINLKARGIEWVPYWSKGRLFRLGKAYFAHGRYTGGNYAKKHLDAYGVNLTFGHLHSIQAYSKRTWGKNETREAACIGTLCRYDQDYLRGNPTDWQTGFCVVHVLPNGFFQRFQVRIFGGTFVSPEGVIYNG